MSGKDKGSDSPSIPTESSKLPQSPERFKNDFFIVGIGASAGGLAAFEDFFLGVTTAEPHMAFVLVQHLSPDYKSILSELIRKRTTLPVMEVENGMQVEPNHVYVIPPNWSMAVVDGEFKLVEPAAPRGQRLPIDFLFRSLALDLQERAIGIVLSGTGSDGTQGLRAIREVNGLTLVQDPASAEHDGMPQSAIHAGLADFQLPPSQMFGRLALYCAQTQARTARRDEGGLGAENDLKKVFELVRAKSGHDFSLYKPNSIVRRTERRMAIHQIATIHEYIRYLEQSPMEVEALFHDLLIGVTGFFRDLDAFKELEKKVIPKLFEGKAPGSSVRVWCTGCSTGEEAYSIAILLQECKEALDLDFKLQVFATDIDRQAIAFARAAVYAVSSVENMTPERLERFFIGGSGRAYTVRKNIRDLMVFSEQNLISDPPFSHLDLITCRNLLIYFGNELQKKVIPLFHFALNPGGFLFLGSSDSAGEQDQWFKAIERKSKLFQRDHDRHTIKRLALGGLLQDSKKNNWTILSHSDRGPLPMIPRLRELTEQALLQSATQVAALVNGQGDILYLHGRTGQYLEPAPGEPGVNNVLTMAREGLKRELTTALHKVVATSQPIAVPGLRIWLNGDFITADLNVRPIAATAAKALGTPLYLVILDEIEKEEIAFPSPDQGNLPAEPNIEALKRELKAKEEYLQVTNEELKTANEDLRSSNEEMQSMNEEMQSANEELETSKEELQSVNEELSTVNTELQSKVAELSLANNDMNNLLAGTGIATVFVDLNLRILRYTPAATSIINLIPEDVNRPVNHIVSNLSNYDQVADDVNAVLNSLESKEVEVMTKKGLWYTMRIQPYRTLENVVEGAVITFVDISTLKQTADELNAAKEVLKDERRGS